MTGDVLSKAHEILLGDRMEQYGDPLDTAGYAACIASAILRRKVTRGEIVVSLLATKLARMGGRVAMDDPVDAAAYLDILHEARTREGA